MKSGNWHRSKLTTKLLTEMSALAVELSSVPFQILLGTRGRLSCSFCWRLPLKAYSARSKVASPVKVLLSEAALPERHRVYSCRSQISQKERQSSATWTARQERPLLPGQIYNIEARFKPGGTLLDLHGICWLQNITLKGQDFNQRLPHNWKGRVSVHLALSAFV